MKAKIQRQLRSAKRRITRRLDKSKLGDCSRPVLAGGNIRFEMAERTRGMTYGGLGAIVLLVRQLGLAEAIDRRLHLLKMHLPYHESDHVLNLAYNALCDGTCLSGKRGRTVYGVGRKSSHADGRFTACGQLVPAVKWISHADTSSNPVARSTPKPRIPRENRVPTFRGNAYSPFPAVNNSTI